MLIARHVKSAEEICEMVLVEVGMREKKHIAITSGGSALSMWHSDSI